MRVNYMVDGWRGSPPEEEKKYVHILISLVQPTLGKWLALPITCMILYKFEASLLRFMCDTTVITIPAFVRTT